MIDSTIVAAPFEPAGAKTLLDRFTVAEAADLARSGNYASAESLLKYLMQGSDVLPEASDLLAKIRAQQGRVLEAAELWRRALTKEPANPAYHAALARLNRMQQRQVWLTFLWPALLAAAVIAICFAVVRSQSSRHIADLARLEERIDRASAAAAKARDVGVLSQSVNELRSEQKDLQGQTQQAQGQLKVLARTSAYIAKTTRDILAVCSRQSGVAAGEVPNAPARSEVANPSPLRLNIKIAAASAARQGDH